MMTLEEIKKIADDIEFVWTEYADEVVIEKAEAAVKSLRELASVLSWRP